MSQPDIVRGTYINILIGDGATPEVFTPLCGINARTFTHQGNTQDVFTRDCADPESVPIRRIIVTGEQWDLSGNGQLNRAQLAEIDAAMNVTKNYRFLIGEPADDLVFGGYYAGPAVMTQKQITGNDNEMAGISLTLASDGAWAFVEV